MEGARSPGSIRLAELMAALSLATDLGLGQPLQHELGVCLAALELADRLGCPAEERADVYYVALVAHVGCTGAAGLFAEWAGGDDIHFQRGAQLLGAASEPSEDLRHFLRRFADDRPLPERVWLRGRMLVGGRARFEVMAANLCEGATILARRLGLPERVEQALAQLTERWDGNGLPGEAAGEQTHARSASCASRRISSRSPARWTGRPRSTPSPVDAERVMMRLSSTPPSPTRHGLSPWRTFLTRGSG